MSKPDYTALDAAILAAIKEKQPAMFHVFAYDGDVNANSLALVHSELIHVCGWDIPGGVIQARCPVYKFGVGKNVPWPGGMIPHKTQVRADLTMFTAVIRALMAGPCLKCDVVAEAGISRSAGAVLVDTLHALKLTHIAEYEERPKRGQGAPMYRWGPGKADKEKREPIPAKELSRAGNRRHAAKRRAIQQQHHLTHFAPAPTARAAAPEPEYA